mgnify:CR=1 FL=1
MLAISLCLSSDFPSAGPEGQKTVFRACALVKERENLLVYKEDTAATDRLCILSTKAAALTGPEGRPVSPDSIGPGEIVEATSSGVVLAIWPPIYPTVEGIAATGARDPLLYAEGMKAAAPHLKAGVIPPASGSPDSEGA